MFQYTRWDKDGACAGVRAYARTRKATLSAHPGNGRTVAEIAIRRTPNLVIRKHHNLYMSDKIEGPGALERSRVSCDPERVEVLLELNGPTVADRPHVGDLCFAFFSLPVKPEVIVAESHDFLAAFALKDFIHGKDELVETRR